jgi:hypothetical protein
MRSKLDFENSESDSTFFDGNPSVSKRMATIYPKYLNGRTFLKDNEEDGQRFVLVLFALL